MQKISRIYVGNYGMELAWYDGQLLDLRDPASGEATDTIINLENGGGKTTLLSFVLSCFEPRQDRWLKHLVDLHRRSFFHEYFSGDGLPAVCLIEWQMPPRIAAGRPYLLVMGQVVSTRATAEKPEVDRVFFSFASTKNLTLENVPAPRLGKPVMQTMQEFTRWLHQAREAQPDVFYTRTHEDWQKHLREERLLDLDMLKMQVEFSASEGGFDKGFLSFKTEEEFLRKLLELTLSETRAAAVRDAVVVTCEKLRRKPLFERRSTELTRLKGYLQRFASSAATYVHARDAQVEFRSKGSALAAALVERRNECSAVAQDMLSEAARQSALESGTREQEQAAISTHHALELLLRKRQADEATGAQLRAETQKAEADLELDYLQAAHALSRLEALSDQEKTLSAQLELQQQGLKPARDHVEVQGALLRAALKREEMIARNAAGMERLNEETAVKAIQELGGAIAAKENQDRELNRDQSKVQQAQDLYETGRARLVQEGLLAANESALTAADARKAASAALRLKHAALLAEQTQLRETAAAHSKAHLHAREVVTRLEGERKLKDAFVAQGLEAKERLAQDSSLRLATESESADPDSPAIAAALERLIAATDKEITGLTLRIAELAASRQAIRETRLAGRNHDVELAGRRLAEMGLKSARPFNTYIAEVEPDAERARAIVGSDPARFLGIAVSPAELDRARGILAAPPKLLQAVVVSPVATTPEEAPAHRFTIPADDDAAFNFAAAERLADSLEQRLGAERARELAFRRRLVDANGARERLQLYLETYGSARIAQARADIEHLRSKEAFERQEGELAENRAAECGRQAEACADAARRKAEEAAREQAYERQLRQFHEEHEAAVTKRTTRLAELSALLAAVASERAELAGKVEFHRTAKESRYRQRLSHENMADNLATEAAGVTLRDKNFPAESALRANPQSLEALRGLYRAARATFEAQEKDQLGLLHSQISRVREECGEAEAEFTKRHAALPEVEVRKRLRLNFGAAIELARSNARVAQLAVTETTAHLRVAQHEIDTYRREHGDFQHSDSDLRIDIKNIRKRSADALEQSRQLGVVAQVAADAASKAREKAAKAAASGKEADQALTSLCTALSLSEPFEAAEIALTDSVFAQAQALVTDHAQAQRAVTAAYRKALNDFEQLKIAASAPALLEIEPDVAQQLRNNEFEAACNDRERLVSGIEERLAATQHDLAAMQADFEGCVGEVYTLAQEGIAILNSAANNKKVPEGAPYVGGKSVLKMRAQFSSFSAEVKRKAIRDYLNILIDTGQIPQKGAGLVAIVLVRMHGRPLGIQVLRMVRDESHQYVPIGEINNSGGEGVAMAMFLYIVINQLRAETQAKLRKSGGGPLILDNPFAKVTTQTLWRAQRMLARAAGLQLIFATALTDYNALGEFGRFIRLRHAGRNSKSGRNHLELVDFQLREPEDA